MHRCGAPVHGTDGSKSPPKDSFEKSPPKVALRGRCGCIIQRCGRRGDHPDEECSSGAVADAGKVARVGGGCCRYPQVVVLGLVILGRGAEFLWLP